MDFLSKLDNHPLKKGGGGGGVHRKLVDPTTRRDLIVLGKDGDILQAVFLRNPIEMTLTPYLCSFLVFGLKRAPSFASSSLPAQETRVVHAGINYKKCWNERKRKTHY